ncbi:cell wall hydrolase [Altererythrobacter arenosus]|uniref:Cell wall hydrolase n=1 Tax=Altererythrobacter arenosus TaxID=3032592 RepID=A0ABY8FNU4_9SPHN|nr:cell wall hydrolase [Altererythrobacter sp. CAU 1644]WFL76695.1 cell wall hydrolase [Altererythrobacter sp. CAU 1644]
MKRTLDRLLFALWGSADSQAYRHRGRRALVLAAAIGVPAFAAPADWTASPADTEAHSELVKAEALPFDQPGMSFPGSAFYYLEDSPEVALALPALDPSEAPAAPAELGKRIETGPSALPFASAGTSLDKARALRCLTQAIYYEAASESDAGQRAVAQVVLNRVAHSAWPSSVCGVVFEGSQRRTGCQFTFTCDGSLLRQPSRKGWDRAQLVAARALAGDVYQPIGLATHYHTNWVNPYWAKTLDHIGTIGAHRFYRWRGRAGQPGAFNLAYHGGESLAPAYSPSAQREAPAMTRASFGGVAPIEIDSPDPVQPAPAPVAESAAPFAGAGRVKDRYARTGQWIAQPGKPTTAETQ